jgi:hypothetical protein
MPVRELYARRRLSLALALCIAALLSLGVSGCSGSSGSNSANESDSGKADANRNESGASDRSKGRLRITEPERYRARITAATGGDATLTYEIAKLGTDRRAGFSLPALGNVVYIEHAGLKYLVFEQRRQYVEVSIGTLAVDLSGLLNPVGIVERWRSRSSYEWLGSFPVNDRAASKFSFKEAQGVVYVDEVNQLPVRAEMANGMAFDLTDVRIGVDTSFFDVPIGFKKVNAQMVSAQVRAFSEAVRSFAEIARTL